MVCGTAGQTLVFAQKCLTKKLWQERRFQQSKSHNRIETIAEQLQFSTTKTC